MALAGTFIFVDNSIAELDDEGFWSHSDSAIREMLNTLTDTLIAEQYSVSSGDQIIWIFETILREFKDEIKNSNLVYKKPPRPAGAVVDR